MTDSELRGILSSILGPAAVPADGDFPLREVGLDSVGMIELLAALEGALSLRFSPGEITPENFGTFRSLHAFLSRLAEAGR